MPFSDPSLVLSHGVAAHSDPYLSNQQYRAGPWAYGGALYGIFAPSDTTSVIEQLHAMKSADGGATWAELDAGNGLNRQSYAACFDGAHTIYIAATSGVPPLPESDINVFRFDLASETWDTTLLGVVNAPHTGAAGGFDGVVFGFIPRPATGDALVLFWSYGASLSLAGAAFSFAGASWDAPFAVDANAPATDPNYAAVGMSNPTWCVDLTERAHVFWGLLDLVGPNSGGHYQAVNTDDSLGAHVLLPAAVNFSAPVGTPAIVAGGIVAPVVDGIAATFYLGTPLNAPVFTLFVPGVDSTAPPWVAGNAGRPPMALATAGELFIAYVSYSISGTADNAIRIARSVNLASPMLGWSAETAFDGESFVLIDPTWVEGSLQNAGPVLSVLGEPYVWFWNVGNPPDFDGLTYSLKFLGALPAALSGLRIVLCGVRRIRARSAPDLCVAPEISHVKVE